jgi:hypothetical protein
MAAFRTSVAANHLRWFDPLQLRREQLYAICEGVWRGHRAAPETNARAPVPIAQIPPSAHRASTHAPRVPAKHSARVGAIANRPDER